jgi:hypothetical protein
MQQWLEQKLTPISTSVDFNEVECVAFGPTDNSWVIIGDGGHCDYGDEIPSELMIQLDVWELVFL